MTSKNSVQLIGHVGADPESVNLQGDGKLIKFSIAVSEKFKNAKGEKVDQTNWFQINTWGKLAGIIEKYVKKGSYILVVGKLSQRSWEKDGKKNYAVEIQATDVLLLDKK